MELLKSEVVINPNYKPSLAMGHMDYFTRALVFAQTNYQDQLNKVTKANFWKLAPTTFFEDYVWVVSSMNEDIRSASKLFPELVKKLSPLYKSFWDLNNFPKGDALREEIISINKNPSKADAIIRCAEIVNRGIKLFGWDEYKDNFLNTPEKLCALPMIGVMGAKQLSRNIGVSSDVTGTAKLHQAAVHWGFDDSESLCAALHQYVNLPVRTIELVMWYALSTFESNTSQT